MIEAEVYCNDQLVMTRTYSDPTLSLETVLTRLESYVVQEQFNLDGECTLRVRFANAARMAS